MKFNICMMCRMNEMNNPNWTPPLMWLYGIFFHLEENSFPLFRLFSNASTLVLGGGVLLEIGHLPRLYELVLSF